MDEEIDQLIRNQNENVIRLNFGGNRFVTKIETLLSIKDTLLYKIVVSKKFNLQDELFFEWNPKIFEIIID